MEIGRFLRPIFLGAAFLPLAGCLAAPDANGKGGAPGFLALRAPDAMDSAGDGDTRHASVTRRASLAAGAVVDVPPPGYCIEGDSLSARKSGGFALLGSCEVLTGRSSGVLADPAVITVTVLRERNDPPDADLLARALGTGRVLERINGDGLTLVHLDGGGENRVPGSDRHHWRGLMQVNGHLVGLALYGPKGARVTGREGLSLMVSLAENIRDASPVVNYAPDSTPARLPDAAADTDTRTTLRNVPAAPQEAATDKKGFKNLFGRLFS